MEKEGTNKNYVNNIMVQRLNSFYDVDKCRKQYLGGIPPMLKRFIEGEVVLSDQEIELSLICLYFVSEMCNISSDLNLMKKEINLLIEHIERIKRFRKTGI